MNLIDLAKHTKGLNVSIKDVVDVLRTAPYEQPAVFDGRNLAIARALVQAGYMEENAWTTGLIRRTEAGERLAKSLGVVSPAVKADVVETKAKVEKKTDAKMPAMKLSDAVEAVLNSTAKGSKLDAFEAMVVRTALARTKGNKTAAARMLGMERKALARKARHL